MKYHFDEKTHTHRLGDKRLHGVTTVLSSWGKPDALINWAVGTAVDYLYNCKDLTDDEWENARTAHLKKRDKAGDRGTEVHAELEVMMNYWMKFDKPPTPETEDSLTVSEQVIQWMKHNKLYPLASEMNVWSEKYWYGGIADGVIEKDGKKYILDFKTSGTVQTKYFYQLAAYSLAVKEMKEHAQVDGVLIVHIPKGKSFNPEKDVYWYYDTEKLEQAWLAILETYKTDKEVSKLVNY